MLRIKYKKTAMGMVVTLLLSSMLLRMPVAMDMVLPSLGSKALPLGLPERIADMPLHAIAPFLGMALAGLVLAILPAGLSRKNMLLAGLLLLILATFVPAFTITPFVLICWRFMAGVGFCIHFCAWVSVVVAYFPRHCAMVVGCLNFVNAVGAILVYGLTGIIRDVGDWRHKLLLLGVGLLLMAFLFLLLMPLFKRASVADRHRVAYADTMRVAKSPWSASPLLLGLAAICVTLVAYSFGIGYVRYLREALAFPKNTAVLVVSLFDLSAFLSPVGGWLGVRHGAFKVLIIAFPITGAIGGLLFMGWQLPLLVLLPLAFMVGFGLQALLYVNLFAAILQSVAPVQSMRTAGLFSAAIALPAPFAHGMFLYLQSKLGWEAGALLHITGGFLVATLLVWLALKARPLGGSSVPPA